MRGKELEEELARLSRALGRGHFLLVRARLDRRLRRDEFAEAAALAATAAEGLARLQAALERGELP